MLPQGCWIWDWNFGWILLTKKACLEGFFAPCSSPFSCFPCPLLFWPVGQHSQPMTPHDWPRGGMGTGQKLAGIGLDWDYNITDTMDHVKTYSGLFLTCWDRHIAIAQFSKNGKINNPLWAAWKHHHLESLTFQKILYFRTQWFSVEVIIFLWKIWKA